MKTFTERYGYSKSRKQLGREDMTQGSRIGLWNVIYEEIIHYSVNFVKLMYFQKEIVSYLQEPVDEFLSSDDSTRLLKYFFLNEETKWFEIYDFIELIISCMKNSNHVQYRHSDSIISFIDDCNDILNKEKSAWRIDISTRLVVPFTDEQEMKSIDQAMQSTIWGNHMKKALDYLSHKENPDYENSIKESISAVESIVKILCQSEKGTLGSLIEKLPEVEPPIHPALLKGFSNLYGFASDAGGIRHASGEGKLEGNFETAQYMLVSCSAFCNFLESKYREKLK